MTAATASAINVTLLNDELDVLLAALFNLQISGTGWFSSSEISRYLRDQFRIAIHWKSIDALFGNNMDSVSRRKRRGRWEYLLLSAGTKRIAHGSDPVVFIDPEKAMQAVLNLH